MWEEAPVSKYQSLFTGGVSVMVLKVEARELWSQAGDPTMGWYGAWEGQADGAGCCGWNMGWIGAP